MAILLGVELFTGFLLWLADVRAFRAILGVLVLFSLGLFLALSFILIRKEEAKAQAFQDFLHNPSPENQRRLEAMVSRAQKESLRLLSASLQANRAQVEAQKTLLEDYESYVETWAHEIKIPLALLTLVLDNQGQAMDPKAHARLDYARHQIQENVSQILTYARIKGQKKDYLFDSLWLPEIIQDILEDFQPLLEEKSFEVLNQISDDWVFTDKRGLDFILRQVLTNAIQYSTDQPKLLLKTSRTEETLTLSIGDHGQGVKACDLPYIFEKGFTGDSDHLRKKATGMGLYLVKEMAEDLKIDLEVWSEWGQGFEMILHFPVQE